MGDTVAADCGALVTGYATDTTQGPAAAFGVPAASLVRSHYVFKDLEKPPSEWGQTSERQVSLIEDLQVCDANFCGRCVNGKALLSGEEKSVTAELVDDVAGKVK